MSRAVLLVLLALVACSKPALVTSVSNNAQITVDTLFVKDGCTVYRFEDDGRSHYFTRCAASTTTESAHSESCGKNCYHNVPESIQTENAQ